MLIWRGCLNGCRAPTYVGAMDADLVRMDWNWGDELLEVETMLIWRGCLNVCGMELDLERMDWIWGDELLEVGKVGMLSGCLNGS